jgi:hypothetical protein
MRGNLTTQGYCLSDTERREAAVGLRFSNGLCLSLVVVALVLQSAAMVFALTAVGVVASFAARHPFDHVEPRRAPPRRRTGAAAQPAPATSRVPDCDGLACARRDALAAGTATAALVSAGYWSPRTRR